MRVSALVVLVVVSSIACSSDPPPLVASRASAIGFVGSLPVESTAVLATNSALIGERAEARGRVAVLAASPGTFGEVLADGVRLSVGAFADLGATSGSESFAYTSIFRYGADVSHAYVHQAVLDEHDDGIIVINSFPPVMPRAPRARAVFAGASPLVVTASSTVTISATGACASSCWSSIEVEDGGVLYLEPGSYQVEHVQLQDRSRLHALGPVELRIAERISTGNSARIEATTARDLRIEVLGKNGGARLPGSTPRAIEIGDGNTVHAILFAPNGTLHLGESSTLLGAALGRDVLIDTRARVTHEDGLLPLASAVPLVYRDHFAATEDEVLHIAPEGVLANDLDPTTYAPLTAELVAATQSGTISLSADGSFTYTPNENFTGDDTFTYRAHGPTGTSTHTTATIHVDSTNDLPLISSIAPSTTFAGGIWRYAVACTDPDLGDTLAYTAINAPASLTTNSNLFTWTPPAAGTYDFDVRCTDTSGAYDEQHVRLTVTPTPVLDQFVAYAQNSIVFRGTAYDGSVGAIGNTMIEQSATTRDVFGASVILRPQTSVEDVYTNNLLEDHSITRGTLATLPNMPALPAISAVTPGTTALIVTTDRTLSSTASTASIDIRPDTCLYLSPGVHHTGDVTVGTRACLVALGPVELRIAGRLTLSDYAYIGPDAATMRIEAHGQSHAVETKNQSALAATVIAPNGTAVFGWRSVNWGAFYARDLLSAEGSIFFRSGTTTPENEAPRIVSTPQTSIFEGATFTYAIEVADTAEDTHTFTRDLGPSAMSLTGNTLTWTPQNADVGTHTIRIRATDAGGLFDTQTFTLTVLNVNDPPIFTTAPQTTANEDELYTSTISTEDPDGDPVSISLLQGPPGMVLLGSALTWTPGQDDIGAHTIVLAATDGQLSITQTFQLIVQAINDPPTFDGTPPTTATEDQHYTFTLQATDPDPSDTHTFALITGPTGMTLTGALLEWTPTNEDVGAHTVTLEVRDLAGAVATTSYTLTVTNENDPPSFISTAPTTATENTQLTFTIEARDPDPSDTITYALDAGPEGMTLNGSAVTWTPSDDQVGSFSVTIRASDPHGASATQSFAIEVANVNDAPVFESTPLTTAFEGELYQYLASARDPDRDDTLTFSVTGPSGLTLNGDELTWTPAQFQIGNHAVTLTVRDAAGATATQSFTITVDNINDPPRFANTPPATATQHRPYTFVAQVLDDSPSLSFTFDFAPLGMNIDANGVLSWTPNEAQSGDYPVILRVTDEGGLFELLSFTITVIDVNDAPTFVSTPPLNAVENERYTYTAVANDPEHQAIGYVILAGPPALSVDAITGVATWIPRARDLGTHPVTLRVIDQGGAHTDQNFAITVVEAPCGPGNTASRCSALAWTHTVRADGLPIATTIEQQGPRNQTFAGESFAALGAGSTGTYSWTFTAPGHVAVHASADLTEQSIIYVAIPRMAPLTDLTGEITTNESRFEDSRVELIFPAGSVAAAAQLTAAIHDGNSLPAYLPRGWSPIVALTYEVDAQLAHTPRAQFRAPPDTALLLATFDEATRAWIAMIELAPTSSDEVEVELGAPATYALLIRDDGPGAPALPNPNAPLASSTLPSPLSQLEASGAVVPEWQITSEHIDEITGIATITVTSEEPIASGLVLPARLFETYASGDQLTEAPYIDLGVAFYRDTATTLTATFPVRPRDIFELKDTHQRIELTEELHFDGASLDANGGSISSGNITLTGAFTDPTLVALTEVEQPAAILAFRSTWTNNTRLHLEARAAPNSNYVLAREEVGYGWTPVERLHTDATGALSSNETELPGITISGTYALFPAPIVEGVVRGTVVGATNTPIADAHVTITGRPWVARTDVAGRFALLGVPGLIEARAERRGTSDNGVATDTLQTTLELTIVLSAQPPRIIRTDPTDNAESVRVVSAIEVFFSEPVLRASVSPNAIHIATVVGTTTLRPDGRSISFLPTRPLAYDTTYEVEVDPNITDANNEPLTGPTTFTFTTELPRTRHTGGARLISYAPGSQNTPCGANTDPTITCVIGTPGVADPNMPVLLVNEETGATTTVLSQPDGSFQTQIRANKEDLLSAIVINQSGTRLIVPLEMQRFDDGSVALYQSGGIVEGANPVGEDPFEVHVEPNTIPRRGVIHLEGRTLDEIEDLTGDTAPLEGEVIFGATLTYEGDETNAPVDVRFPVDEDLLIEGATYLLTAIRRVELGGEELVTYEVLDRMQPENGALVTHSYPMHGLYLPALLMLEGTAQVTLATIRLVYPIPAFTGFVVECPINSRSSSCDALKVGFTALGSNVLDPGVLPQGGRRMSGAIVFSTLAEGVVNAQHPAAVTAGQLVAVSDRRGQYTLAAPFMTTGTYVLRAMHLDFPSRQAISDPFTARELPHNAELHLVFETDGEQGATPPNIQVSHTPHRPAVGQTTQVVVYASPTSATSTLAVHQLVSLVDGQTVAPEDVVISAPSAGSGGRTLFTVTSSRAALVRLRATAYANGRYASAVHAIYFGGAPTPSTAPPRSNEPSNESGPEVLRTWPPREGLLRAGAPIVIEFNEPISDRILQDPAAIGLDSLGLVPLLTLSSDQRRLEILYTEQLPPGRHELRLSSIIDLTGNELASFVLGFYTQEPIGASLEGIGLGGGAVVHGSYAYVLDRTGGTIRVYDISTPSTPVLELVVALPGGYPRGLVLVPDYSYVRPSGAARQLLCGAYPWEQSWSNGFHPLAGVQSGCMSPDRTLLAVVGGTSDHVLSETIGSRSSGQYLRIFDITGGPAEMTMIGSSVVTVDATATLGRLVWSPPELAYLRRSGGRSTVDAVNLQTYLFGLDLTPEQLLTMPSHRSTPGLDLTGDGDYADQNEQLPMPPYAIGGLVGLGFAGLELSVGVTDTTQQITDYAFFGPRHFVGTTLSRGELATIDGLPTTTTVAAAYRTISASGGRFGHLLPRIAASFDEFGAGAQLETVAFFPSQSVGRTFVDLAIVGAFYGTDSRLFALDITDVLNPHLLGEIAVPGRIQKIEADLLLRGVLRAYTSNDALLIDVERLRIVGTIAGVGTSHDANGSTAFGVHVLSDRERVAFTGPELYLVSFPEEPAMVSPRVWLGEANELVRKQTMDRVFRGVQTENDLRLARAYATANGPSQLTPPSPNTHFYVLMYAPGSAAHALESNTSGVELMLEVVNDAGYPLANRMTGFAPVRAATEPTLRAAGVFAQNVRPLHALRLSDDPTSAYYNVYLSDPFAVVHQEITNLEELRVVNQRPRHVFHSGDGVRVSLDPQIDPSNVLAPFASRIAGKEIALGTAVTTTSYPVHRILGPHPAPIVGAMKAPGTEEFLSMQNGETRLNALDLALPSPQLSFAFVRNYVGQDLTDGIFGPGFDFNYNQRLVEAKPENVPEGTVIEFGDRGGSQLNVVIQSRDVVLHNGDGAMITFRRFAGAGVPSAYADDDLLARFTDTAIDWYLPPPCVFDALLREQSGDFLRVTPDGTLYSYSPSGRLQKIFHRYEKNWQRLVYGDRGELRVIEDRSVNPPRTIALDYYRRTGAPLGEYDLATSIDAHDGLVHAIRDHLGRVVSFHYDARSRLVLVEGVRTPGGRKQTHYNWDLRAMTSVADGSDAGEPTAAASADNGALRFVTGVRGNTEVGVSHANGRTNAYARTADGVRTDVLFTAFGMPERISLVGRGGTETTTISYTPGHECLPASITKPRGNSIHYVYDLQHDNLRSRGNVKTITYDPGAEGVDPLVYSIDRYSEKFNIPMSITDLQDRPITIDLTGDERNVARVSYRDGLFELYGYDPGNFGLRVSRTAVDGTTEAWDYDSSTKFLTAHRRGSIVTYFDYDHTDASGLGLPHIVRGALGQNTVIVYDDLGQEISWTKGHHVTAVVRDANGFIEEINSRGDETPYRETRRYDQRGFMTQRTQETLGSVAPIVTTYVPDDMGRVWYETIQGQTTITYGYDLRGRIHQVRRGDQITSYEYDLNGNLIRRSAAELLGITLEERGYDRFDRLTRITEAEVGAETRMTYFDSGQIQSVSVVDQRRGGAELSSYVVEERDAIDRPLKWSEGGIDHAAAYDAVTRTSTETGALGVARTLRYETSGLVTSERVGGLYAIESIYNAEGMLTDRAELEGDLRRDYGGHFVYSRPGHLIEVQDALRRPLVSYVNRYDGLPRQVTRSPRGLDLTTTIHRSTLGEYLGTTSAEQVRNFLELDEQRRPQREGPANAGRTYSYDGAGRLSAINYPDGTRDSFNTPDVLGNPTSISIPGGSMTLAYDLRGRMTSRDLTYLSVSSRDTFDYDALDRLRNTTFAAGSIAFNYDLKGAMTSGRLALSSGTDVYEWIVTPYDNLAPRMTEYPSDAEVTTTRAAHGRLQSLEVDGSIVVDSMSYATATAPSRIVMGSIAREDVLDHRRRLLQRRYVAGGGRVIADVRYAYDDADRETARQDVHRGARADLYGYDRDSRLISAQIAARPAAGERVPAPWAVDAPWRAGDYGRTYRYDLLGADRVASTTSTAWPGESAVAVASNFGTADSSGHASPVDGLIRSTDALGNTTRTHLETGDAQRLDYDGLSRLTLVVRADGSSIRYEYRSDGPLVRRTVTCAAAAFGCVPATRVYVYDGLRLLEEYELVPTGGRVLMARYYYADEGEVPIAAHLRHSQTQRFERYVFTVDRMGSITGVLDPQGNWVERISYDPWGRPKIEPADTDAPEVSAIVVDTNGDILVAFTEPVLPPPVTSTTTALITTLTSLDHAIQIIDQGDSIPTNAVLDETVPGFQRGTVLRLTATRALTASAALTLDLLPNQLIDSWSNNNAEASVLFVYTPGEVYAGPAQGSTATAPIERSTVNNALLFQSHLYDYDADLLHMKARVLDPYTGSFLQRDPAGYVDSVNLYAALANDPINQRDPTGRAIPLAIAACLAHPACRVGAGAVIGGAVSVLFDALRQGAEIFHDSSQEFSWSRLANAGLVGVATGAAAAWNPATVGSGLAAAGAAYGTISAGRELSQGRYATAAVDAVGAALSALGARSLRKLDAGARPAANRVPQALEQPEIVRLEAGSEFVAYRGVVPAQVATEAQAFARATAARELVSTQLHRTVSRSQRRSISMLDGAVDLITGRSTAGMKVNGISEGICSERQSPLQLMTQGVKAENIRHAQPVRPQGAAGTADPPMRVCPVCQHAIQECHFEPDVLRVTPGPWSGWR